MSTYYVPVTILNTYYVPVTILSIADRVVNAVQPYFSRSSTYIEDST